MTLPDRLRLYARQFEDQHAPANMTMALRAAADEIERLRAALQEKVSRALWETTGLSAFIDAAIDIVLEEAARVADAEASVEGIAQRIAAAIRAMKKD